MGSRWFPVVRSSWRQRTTRCMHCHRPPVPSFGRPTSALRCRRDRSPVATSARRSVSRAPRWSTRPGPKSSWWPTRCRTEAPPMSWSASTPFRVAPRWPRTSTRAGAKPAALLQRTGLALDANQVVFGFGGNYGDCSAYRGWLVGVNESGGTPVDFAVDSGSGESQGAIWMGGAAPEVDSHGNLWVGVGNGSVTTAGHAYDDSDSVLELSSSLHLLQYFAPTSWASDNAHDFDLSMAPALLANGQVVASGKSAHAYLLNGSHLGGIGGQAAELESVCGDDVDGGTAVMGTTVFIPCLSGIVALQVGSPAGLQVLWTSRTGGDHRSSRPDWCGPLARTACSAGSTRPPAPSGSGPPSVRRSTTSRLPASGAGSSWRRPARASSPSTPPRPPRPPTHRRRLRRPSLPLDRPLDGAEGSRSWRSSASWPAGRL